MNTKYNTSSGTLSVGLVAIAMWLNVALPSPVQAQAAVTIATGGAHTCARFADGSVKCWGRNDVGQLGIGTTTGPEFCIVGTVFGSACSFTPVSVTGISIVTALATGGAHTCALLADGTVRCWGANFSGQLGNGTFTASSTPVLVSGLTSATAVTAGGIHTCALLADGSVKCWGSDSHGQLGNGAPLDPFSLSSTPLPVSGITTATAVAGGRAHTCALLADGTVRCWGDNDGGQLGNRTTARSSTPVPVVAIPPSPTQAGSGIVIRVVDATTGKMPVTALFSTVSQGGTTSLTTSSTGPAPPHGFMLGNPATYYDLTTTAFFDSVKVCINYSGITFTGPPALFHFQSGAWVNVTTSVNPATTTICGSVTSLSLFALFVRVVPVDTTPPVIVPTVTPAPNAAGWNNTDVTVSWSVSDPESGIASSIGCSRTTLTTETAGTTLTCTATNGVGLSASVSVTVKIDKTPPTVTATRTPAPNAHGWNNTDVTVQFTATDTLSGTPGPSVVQVLVSTEGAGQTATQTFTDRAGNTTTATLGQINIDKTPPTITGTRTPAPNAQGWNNTDVTVTFTCADALSGVDSCGPTPQVVTTEGRAQARTATAVDLAGNSASATVSGINIDKTPPEAFNQFDPATRDVVLFGRDALSGVPPGPVAPLSVVPTRWGTDGPQVEEETGDEGEKKAGDQDEAKEPAEEANQTAELRTYKVQDLAGNTLLVVEKVKRAGHELKVRIVSLQYQSGPVLTPPPNTKAFEWALAKKGTLKELEQKLRVGQGPAKQEVEAKFEGKKNQTTIMVKHPKPETKLVRPGLVLLRFATSTGSLKIEF